MLNRFRPLIDTLLLLRNLFASSRTIRRGAVFALAFAAGSANAEPASSIRSLEALLQSQELTVLADVKHGVRERIEFFSSTALFEAMKRAGVRHVAIEMPRVLGRQAMGIESEVDVNAFAQDVIRSGHWHFVDPDHPDEIESATQERVATALGRQVLLAKTLGINPIFYDFNNPLGGFTTFNDPVYRCIAELSGVTWVRYGLDGKISKAERDAAIMRERFSHDDELADYIEQNVRANGGGKIVLIPGYAHAALPGGITERLAHRLRMKATVVAVFRDAAEDKGFHDFLWQQAHLLSIDLSRPPHFYYSIATDTLRADNAPGRYVILDGSTSRTTPSVCHQLAHID